jgi:hypothetical protein
LDLTVSGLGQQLKIALSIRVAGQLWSEILLNGGGLGCRILESPSQMTTATIIERIVHNRAAFEARNAKKAKSEQAYYTTAKQYVDEV